MVTLPSEAAANPGLVRGLVERGMNLARINCAHDDPTAWRAMAQHVRVASAASGRSCLVAMDLAGPKLRTGPIEPGPRVLKLRPCRDALGRVSAPAHAWLTSAEDPAPAPVPTMSTLPVPGEWLRRRQSGDIVGLYDTRGAKRHLTLTAQAATAAGFVVTTDRTAYLATGTVLSVDGVDDPTKLAMLPQLEQALVLRPGDTLLVTRDCSPAPVGADGVPWIGCTLPEVFDNARCGERIYFDDGWIGGEIVAVHPGRRGANRSRCGNRLEVARGQGDQRSRHAITGVCADR
jgi:pyruvate kinase